MMTRREKLLMRPWQLRRYNNHKKKVINAVPVVDFGPPAQRKHVTVKLKKLQKERERQMEIEESNFKLLQHLNKIMTEKRMDDYREKKPPNFLGRVAIYHRTRSPTPCLDLLSESPASTPKNATRKSRCLACSPHTHQKVASLPEGRVPWDPPKKILNRRQSASSAIVRPMRSDFDFRHVEKSKELKRHDSEQTEKSPLAGKKFENLKGNSRLPLIDRNKASFERNLGEQKIILRQGELQIAVNFPSFAEVKVIRGKKEKYLERNYCECKSFRSNK